MRAKILSLFLVLISSNIAYADSNINFETEIQNTIENEGIVGLSWSTVSNGHVEIGSAGYANISKLELMKPAQKMHVGSVTKSVLAIGVLHLIFEGRLSLDSNVEAILSELKFDNPWHHRSPIMVQNLLDHTAGLDDIRMWQLLSTKPLPNTPLTEAFKSSGQNLLMVRTEPGTQYSYSNMGYTLLAMVIEAVTKQRYEEFLDSNLLIPLGMTDSSFEFISQQHQSADPLLAMGYHENNVTQAAVPNYLRPAGQFTTTAPDMAKFMDFLLDGGKVNGEVFLHPEHMEMLTEPLNTDAHKAGLRMGHGLALAKRDRHNVVGMCHPGTTFGFRAYICLFPDEKKGFFYAANTDSETANYEKFNELFITKLSVMPAPIAENTESKVSLSTLEGIYQLSPNRMAEFEFIDMLFGFIWLEQVNEQLLIKSLQSADRRLIQVGDHLFRDINRTQASHVFYRDNENKLFLSDGLKTFKQGSALTLGLYWLSLIFGLIGLLYIFLVGIIRAIKREKAGFDRIKWVFLNLLLFSLPSYLFVKQSFLQFGDITPASVTLALLSGILPLTLLFSLWVCLRGNLHSKIIKLDVVAIVFSTQFILVLTHRGLLPIIFWQ